MDSKEYNEKIFKYVRQGNLNKVKEAIAAKFIPKLNDFRFKLISMGLKLESTKEGKIKLIDNYINAGMKITPTNKKGESMFDIAIKNNDLEMLELLISVQV